DRWLDASPESALALTSALRARAGDGTTSSLESAIAEFERRRDAMWREQEVKPHTSVLAQVDELRAQLSIARSKEMLLRAAAEMLPKTLAPRRRRARAIGVAAGLVLFGAAAGGVAMYRRSNDAESRRPLVAVTAIEGVAGDTSVAWLRAGLPRLIAS